MADDPKKEPTPRREEIDLDADDEDILDQVWDQIGRERAAAKDPPKE